VAAGLSEMLAPVYQLMAPHSRRLYYEEGIKAFLMLHHVKKIRSGFV
jgi:hypothetical protein